MSPFDNATVLAYDEDEVLIFAKTDKPLLTNPTIHTVLPGENLTSISWKYYGDSGNWAKIALANDILNPFIELIPGQQIYIP